MIKKKPGDRISLAKVIDILEQGDNYEFGTYKYVFPIFQVNGFEDRYFFRFFFSFRIGCGHPVARFESQKLWVSGLRIYFRLNIFSITLHSTPKNYFFFFFVYVLRWVAQVRLRSEPIPIPFRNRNTGKMSKRCPLELEDAIGTRMQAVLFETEFEKFKSDLEVGRFYELKDAEIGGIFGQRDGLSPYQINFTTNTKVFT